MGEKELGAIVKEIRGTRTLAEFAEIIGCSESAMSRYEHDQRAAYRIVAALLRIAEPVQQATLLKVLGITDVEQFATAILASAGVELVEIQGTLPAAAPATDGKEQEQ